jgi:hypothetical protein
MEILEEIGPGLNGDYQDSCIVCLRGTDTALAFKGDAEWIITGLIMLGVPEDEALATISYVYGCPYGIVPDGTIRETFRVCGECVAGAKPNFPAPVLAIPGATVPCVGQF